MRSLDREGALQAVVVWGLFRIPKGLNVWSAEKRAEGLEYMHPQAEFTFRTDCLNE